MREIVTAWVVIAALLALVAAAPVHALPQVDLAVIVNVQAAMKHMSAVEMETMFTRTQTRWDDGTPIVPINAPPGSDLRVQFDQVVLRLNPDEVGRFWIDRRVRGLGMPPRHLGEPSTIVRVVEKLNGAIAYAPEELVRDARVRVVARIRQGKVLPP
jgi:ABC-type phosphate transport system substrate-binding protein